MDKSQSQLVKMVKQLSVMLNVWLVVQQANVLFVHWVTLYQIADHASTVWDAELVSPIHLESVWIASSPMC